MNFFERRRQQPGDPSAVGRPQEDLVVPDGHKVDAYHVEPLPGVRRSTGGFSIVGQGSSSDEAAAELERLLRELAEAIPANRSRVLIAEASRISELFAPTDAAVLPVAGALLWVLDPAVFVGSSLGPLLLQMLLRNLHAIGTRTAPPLLQLVSVPEFRSPRGRLFADLVSGLGLEVREYETNLGAVLVEVHRPEGVILSALPGQLFAPDQAADPYARQSNEQKDRAEEQGDVAGRQRLEKQELEELTRRLAPARSSGASAVARAPHLRRLLLEAHEGQGQPWQALCEELLRRETPLLVVVDPKTGAAAHRSWPDRGTALPVYPDRMSLLQTANDMGIPLEFLAMAEMPARDLFSWMAKHRSAVAINVFRDPKTPLYVWLHAEAVQTLAAGGVPRPF